MKRAGSEGYLTPRESKKGKSSSKGSAKVGKGGKGGGGGGSKVLAGGIPWDHGVPQTIHAFKALVPDNLAITLLGKAGATKDQIHRETGAKLVFSNRGDYFPASNFRVLGVYADDDTSINSAFNQVMARIVELGEEERRSPPPGGPELLGKEPGEFVFRFAVTVRMCTQIIGTGGANIQKIRQDSGAKVFIENDTHCGHRMGRVIGGQESILSALAQLNEVVQSECQDPIFVPFAGIVNFSDKDPRHLDRLFADPSAPPHKGGKEGGKDSGKGKKAASSFVGSLGPASSAKGSRKGRGDANSTPLNKGSGKGEGGGEGGRNHMQPEEAIERLAEDLNGFPEGTLEIPYSMECELATSLVEVLSQPDEQGTTFIQHVQDTTGTTITIGDPVAPKEEGGQEVQGVAIVGTLPHTYSAHAMLMMRSQQTLADWAEQERLEREEAAANEEPAEDPEALRARIAELQEMLKKAGGA